MTREAVTPLSSILSFKVNQYGHFNTLNIQTDGKQTNRQRIDSGRTEKPINQAPLIAVPEELWVEWANIDL